MPSSNLPPGVTLGMIEDHFAVGPCDICGRDPESDCVCPECSECGAVGDKKCYTEHGLTVTKDQVIAWHDKTVHAAEEAVQDAKMNRDGAFHSLETDSFDAKDWAWIAR